jgi:hypothetical protein
MKALELLLAACKKHKDAVNIVLFGIIGAFVLGRGIAVNAQRHLAAERVQVIEERVRILDECLRAAEPSETQSERR